MSGIKDLPCQELKKRVSELERLNVELLNEQHQETMLDYAWSGNLGHWYFNVETNSVVFDQLKVQALGFEKQDLPETVPYHFFTDRLHPEDYEKTMQAMRDHLTGKKPVYECSYRIQTKDGSYKWFYDRGKITQRTDDGRPAFLAGIVFDTTEAKQRESSLEEENKELRQEAATDALTGLPNRRSVHKELQSRMDLSKARELPLSVCMMDIDHFKKVNDEHGHVYGDYVLQEVASVFKEETRGLDLIGRYGGEEFIAIFFGADHDQSVSIAERIREKVQALKLKDQVSVTISGGVAAFTDQNITELIEQADARLYTAKHQGRNRIVG
jgi:diguanylate cyclase (GGDEF)-like protein/PAS domain S-box-containing protein